MKSKKLILIVAALLCFVFTTALPARAQNNNVTISAADFQRMVYSANLYTQLALKPGLGACLRTLLEMQRRNPAADPMALADVSLQALQYYRTNEPFYIRTNGYPDEILAAYLDALRHIPAHTNFVPANLTMLNYFMLNTADWNFDTNYVQTPVDLINSAEQQLLLAKDEILNRQTLVDDCVARAQGNAAFAAAMDSLLLPETGVSLQDTPAEIIGNTNSPLHDDVTMTTLLALSQASGNGSLTVSSNQLITLFTNEMQTVQSTINTNLAVLAQINESQPNYLAYLTNQAAIDANVQLVTTVQQGQPARLASASAAVLVQSKLLPVNQQSAQMEGDVNSLAELGGGILSLCKGDPAGADSVVSGGLDVFNLFTGNQSPQDVMANQISNIQTMMGDLNTNINYRFDRVDQSLTTIFTNMNQQFRQIVIQNQGTAQAIATLKGKVDDIRSALMDVQGSLDLLATHIYNDFDDTLQQPLWASINDDLLYQIRHPGNGPIAYSEYQTVEPFFTTYATTEAGGSVFCPSYSSSETPESQFNQYPDLEFNLNYIKGYLSQNLGVSNLGGNEYSGILDNPDEWFIAAYAYLQLAGENPMYFRKFTASDLAPIIGHGQNDADFCASLTFIPGTTNINWTLWNALETNYTASLYDFSSQVSATETAYANANHFNLGVWRQWEAATPRLTATATAVLGAPADPSIPASLTNVVEIAAGGGDGFGLALRADGTVVGWGYNYYGQTNIPAGLTNVVAIAAGDNHALALKADGTVVGWGDNYYGEINIPAGLTNVVAIAAGGGHSLALKADGTVVGWGSNGYGQATIPTGLANVVAIAAGSGYSLALKADGTVVGWGSNGYGQATIPTGLANVVAIAAGVSHSLALKADGTVVGWGDNYYGESTSPAGLSNVVAIATGYLYNLALKADGTVVGWGNNNNPGVNTIPAGLTNVMAIAANQSQSYFLTATNTSGFATSGGLAFIRAEIPERLGTLFQGCNSNTIAQLASADPLNTAGAQLSGAKLLLSAVLQLGMPYTLADDGVLHGFLYGNESLMDSSGATTFLQNQNAQLQASPNSAPQSLTVEGALGYVDFTNRLNQDLNNLQAIGQPEIPRLVGQTLRLLNLLNDAWTQPTNSPPPALEISSQTNTPSLLLYGEPYMNYTLQYQDSLGSPGWTSTTLTNLQDEETIVPPFSGGSQRFYRLMLPTP